MASPIIYTNYSTQKIFLHGQFFKSYTYTDSGSGSTLTAGMVMGQILATGKVVPQASGASDGSEFPIGILGENYTVGASATVTVDVCIAGDLNQNAITFNGTDTLDTVVGTDPAGGRIGTLITRNTLIKLYPSTELNNYDN